ncbi:MAG: DUF2007 domain-containing protein [Lentisphaerales bacterium]|nr:DUF2007 domain-containing protein [Lentisphaerales bacterium]
MKLIDASPYPHSIYILRSALESEGIACTLNNENLSQLSGEVPVTSCYVEIYVADEFEEKAFVIRDRLRGSEPGSVPLWTCQSCQEEIEEQYDICWNCEAVKP